MCLAQHLDYTKQASVIVIIIIPYLSQWIPAESVFTHFPL